MSDSHMHDFEAHVRAVEEDLEYYRAKRIEPRIFTLLRRGFIEFTDLFNAAAASSSKDGNANAGNGQEQDLEGRIRTLEDGPDDYVRDIGLITSALGDHVNWQRVAPDWDVRTLLIFGAAARRP
jgi:hypothetical protein